MMKNVLRCARPLLKKSIRKMCYIGTFSALRAPFLKAIHKKNMFRSLVDSRPRRFVSADKFILSVQVNLSPAIDFSTVGKQAAEPETKK